MIPNLDDLRNLTYWLEIAQDTFASSGDYYAEEVRLIEEMLNRIARAMSAYSYRIIVIHVNQGEQN